MVLHLPSHDGVLKNAHPFTGKRSILVALIWVLMCTILFTVQGCSPKQERTITELHIGILPDRNEEVLRSQYTPLFDYLAQQLDLPYKFIIPENYDDLVDQFSQGHIDLAYFGGVTFIQAQRKANAIPVVMRDVDARFTSYFVVNADNKAQGLADLKEQRLSFGAKNSTSGHYMPRHFMLQEGIIPESFFNSVEYSGAHDKTIFRVRDRQVDLGAVNAQIYNEMLASGRIEKTEMRVIWETQPYTDYVWAVRPDLGDSLKNKIRDAFLDLSPDNRQHKEILKKVGASIFFPADTTDFKVLNNILEIKREN